MFSNTVGMHAFASVFLAFCRPYVISSLASGDQFDHPEPRVTDMDFRWFLLYTVILVFLHHVVLFFVEVFRFTSFFSTMFTVIISSLLTTTLIVAGFVALKKPARR